MMAFDPSILAKLSPKSRQASDIYDDEDNEDDEGSDDYVGCSSGGPQTRVSRDNGMQELPQSHTQTFTLKEELDEHIWGNVDFSKGDTDTYLQKLLGATSRPSSKDQVERIRSIGQLMMNWTHLFATRNSFLMMFISELIDLHSNSIPTLGERLMRIYEGTKELLNSLVEISTTQSLDTDHSEYSAFNIGVLKKKVGDFIANQESILQVHSTELKNLAVKAKSWVSTPDVFLERIESTNSNFAASASRLIQAVKLDPSIKTFSHLGKASGNLWLNQFIFTATVRNYWKHIKQKYVTGIVAYCKQAQKIQVKVVKYLLKMNSFAQCLVTDMQTKQHMLERIAELIKDTEALAKFDFRSHLHTKYQKIVSRVLGDKAGQTPAPLLRFFDHYSFDLLPDNCLCGYFARCFATVKTSNKPCYAFIDVILIS
jgi:hypothetical protein